MDLFAVLLELLQERLLVDLDEGLTDAAIKPPHVGSHRAVAVMDGGH